MEQLVSRARTDVLLPQPAVAEMEYGLARLPRSKRKNYMQRRWEILLSEFQRALWTDSVSRAFGGAKADLERRGIRIEDFDVTMAAHALALEATLVTGNAGYMQRVRGLKVDDWSRPGA